MAADCIKRIIELSRGALNEKQARVMLDDLRANAERQRGLGLDFEDAVLERAIAMKSHLEANAAVERRNAQINIIKRRELSQRADVLMKSGLTVKETLRAMLLGTEANVKSGRASVAARQNALADKYIGGMIADLEREQLMPAFNSRDIDLQVAQELWQLTTPGGKPGISKSPEAQAIARIVNKYQTVARERANRAGANIGELDGYITRQSHNAYRIKNATFEKWAEAVLPKLDAKRTFEGASAREFLKAAYDGIVTGVHLSAAPEEGGKLFAFKGPANLAKKISSERVLHFKSADDWFAYNQEFGMGSVMDAIVHGLDIAGRNTALMEAMGTNPRAMFDNVAGMLKEKHRGDAKAMKGLSDFALNAYFGQVDGTVNFADNPKLARFGAIVRAQQAMSKLGGAVISSITDIPTLAAELRYQGKGWLESRALAWRAVFTGRGPKERRELASLLGVGMDGLTGAITARFNATDDLPGRMTKLMRQFFKLSGLTWWTDTLKSSVGMVMSHDLARMKGMGWDKLPAAHKEIFGLYGLDAMDWDNIRSVAVKEVDGREYITPDAVDRLEILNQREKDALSGKLSSYFVDRVNHAVITPDQRENAILNLGLRRGTPAGEAIRFIMQFKAFPVAFANKVIGRAWQRGRGDMLMLVGLMAEMTVYGYFAMSAKDMLKGREPRGPNDPKTIAAAFVQGGGAGIYGDFFFGEYNRFGGGGLETLMGPAAGSAGDIARVFAKLRSGEDASSTALNTAIANVPYANMFWVKPAVDHLFTYQLQEQLNPGYLRRMERRIENENNQRFWLKPSEAAR